eukprot:TRINITY_DN9785_c0_g1_i12.p2 TRINITY_DN9785_c0_g1~~TRINITY_DN9785_c0_g1_i12.p2  ORF type:complete len:101 (+),score=8.92 TRINITY_DN9785_c0_g1_i12:385-687(+)
MLRNAIMKKQALASKLNTCAKTIKEPSVKVNGRSFSILNECAREKKGLVVEQDPKAKEACHDEVRIFEIRAQVKLNRKNRRHNCERLTRQWKNCWKRTKG